MENVSVKTENKIIHRIQKLLKLAGNAGSEAEAALAAERAAALMAQYEIHEAEVALASGTEVRTPEPIEKAHRVTGTKKKVAWHMRVTSAVASSYGATAYWIGGAVVLFGRLSAVQAAGYTSQYLMREVERITDKEAPTTSYSKTYRNAFRLGCASRVAYRVEEAARAARKNPAAAMAKAAEVMAEDLDAGDPSAPTNEPAPVNAPVNAMALAVIEKDREEVEAEYKKYSAKWRSAGPVGKVSNGSGYEAGKRAGDRVNIAGRSRGGLKAGQGVLK